MSSYTIQIDDNAIMEQINLILNTLITSELQRRYSVSQDEIKACIKELIYDRKDEILKMVVDKASKELVRKGLPKLLERMEDSIED